MKGFFITPAVQAEARGCNRGGTRHFQADATALPRGRGHAELEDGYGGETTVSVDFYNNKDKTVTALEVSVPAAAGYLMRQEIVCTIPPGGSTRLDVIMDDAPAEPVAAAITEIVYEDGSRFFDPGGRSSILWW